MNTVVLNRTRRVRKSYAEQVYDYIKGLILSGELRQGDKVVEDKIAERFGVSRTPIREALTRLQAYGLVHLEPRSYAEVVSIGKQQAHDIAELRLVLERAAFRLLCATKAGDALQQLHRIAQVARDALLRRDKAGYFEADSEFHQTAADYSGNSALADMYRQFDGKVQLLRIAQDVPFERLEVYMRQHFDIVELLRDQQCASIDELLHSHVVHDLAPSEPVTISPMHTAGDPP